MKFAGGSDSLLSVCRQAQKAAGAKTNAFCGIAALIGELSGLPGTSIALSRQEVVPGTWALDIMTLVVSIWSVQKVPVRVDGNDDGHVPLFHCDSDSPEQLLWPANVLIGWMCTPDA